MKKIAIGFAGLIVILGFCVYLVFFNLDHIIKTNVEKYASAATQTTVDLDKVQLTLTSGDGTLSGLTIGNPKEFTTKNAFYLGLISVQLDIGTIRGAGPIVIRQMIIDKPQVTYELLNSGNSNLQTIQSHIEAYVKNLQHGAEPQGNVAPSGAATTSNRPSRKIIIKNLVIQNGQVAISQEMLQGRQLGVGLPEIHLTDIGQSSGGATAGQVAEQILGAITSAAIQTSVTELAKEKINGLLKEVPAASIGKAAVGAVGTQLKGVFGQ